jgi:hypothetical protein
VIVGSAFFDELLKPPIQCDKAGPIVRTREAPAQLSAQLSLESRCIVGMVKQRLFDNQRLLDVIADHAQDRTRTKNA